MSLDRKGEDRALTESIVVITEKGTCKSFSPTEFNRTFHVRRSETGSKPMSIRNDSLQCLAIPRPAKGVSKDVHTGVPKSKAEYDKIRAAAIESKSEVTKVFSTKGWKGAW
jgi:hypothetical protein